MKQCTKCGIEKPMEEFSKSKKENDGKQAWCKQCINDYRIVNKLHLQEKAKEFRLRNKAEIVQKKKEYYLLHQDEIIQSRRLHRIVNKETYHIVQRRCHAKHKKERNAVSKEYRKNNLESITEYMKEYLRRYNKTPEGRMVRARSGHRRRYAIRNVECTLTLPQWNKIIELQGNKCVLCGERFTKKDPATKDHIIPVIPYNGPFTMENIQAVHSSCNSRKCNRLDKSNIVVWISAISQEA